MGQKQELHYENRTVSITNDKYSYWFSVVNKPVKRKVKENVDYYWYKAGEIHKNEEGFTGSLLNGKFEKYDNKGNLIETGCFKKGVRHGLWKLWNEQGGLVRKTFWKKGFREQMIGYSESGEIKEIYNYKNAKKDGKCLFQKNGKDTTVYFKRGTVYTPLFIRVKRIVFEGKTKNKSLK
jgi:antitoxin component YwqK of YwqJK toxin-antitoxin module